MVIFMHLIYIMYKNSVPESLQDRPAYYESDIRPLLNGEDLMTVDDSDSDSDSDNE